MTFFERAARFFGVSRQDWEIRRALAELSSYTDRELADIGLNRGNIREAVLYGRQGADVAVTPSVANDDRRQRIAGGRAA